MADVEQAGVRIHYEVEGEGPPLLLMHGMGGTVDNWRRTGYVEALRGRYQLILIDSRGCGSSDKPHDPAAYSREHKVADVCAVLDDLGLERAYYWGYSMGASNGWAMGMLRPERLFALVLGGYPALSLHPAEENRVRWQSRAKLMKLGMDVYVAGLEMEQGPLLKDQRARLLANDGEAYAAQQLANLEWGVPDEDVRAMTVPALVYSGTEDHAHPGFNSHELCKRSAELAPNAAFLPVPDHTHTQTFQDREFIQPHVLKFLAEVEVPAHA